MDSKATTRLLIAVGATVLLTAWSESGVAGAAAFPPVSLAHPGGDDGNLYEDPETFIDGQTVRFTANFPSSAAGEAVTLYKETSPDDFTSTGKTDDANSYGNAYVNYAVNGDQRVFARASGGDVTEIDTLEPQSLGSCTDTGNFYTTPSTVAEGQLITLTGNFPDSDANRTVIFLRKIGDGDYESVGTDAANSYGNAYLYDHKVADGPQTFYAYIAVNNTCTEKHPVTPIPSSALLDPTFTPSGTDGEDVRAKATFSPAQKGASAQLQVKSIKDGSWDTIETATQDANGVASFTISDPLEVEHEYRVTSNGIITTNSVTWAGPLLDKGTGVATVHFNSNDGESVNTRTKYFEGEFALKGGANFPDCGDEGVFKGPGKEEKAEMKGRGNYSWSFDKKSFSLKLDDKNNLCGLGSSTKWALVANHYDRSLIRNPMASWVGTKFSNLGWTPQSAPVDLYVNGSYRGAYTLVERINFEGGRLDYAELKAGDDPTDCSDATKRTGSYLMEWDYRKGAEYNFTAGSRGYVGLKEPEDEDYCPAMGSYINGYVDAADKALFGSNFQSDTSGWKKYIDEASAVDYYLAMELLKPVDGNMWASVYMYKPRGEKLHMGPLWDFDLAEGSANRAGNVVSPQSWYLRNNLGVSAQQTSKTWFNRLNEDPDFRAAVKKRWNEVDQDLHPSTFVAIYRTQIEKSATENYKKWSHDSHISKYQVIKSSWSADVEYVRSWLESRNSWMNSQLDNGD